jgi:putative ABC transport system substrate-binding protein
MRRRRKLLVALGASVLAAPFVSLAQKQSKIWRIGFLSQRGRPESLDSENPGAFRRGMRERGHVEGKTFVIEWRFADGKAERLPGLVAELVHLNVDVIVTGGTPDTSAAQKATTTIPIVMANAGDPVGSGFVKSLAHPGGNITGLSNLSADIAPKLLELLRTMAPKVSRVAVLLNPANSTNAAILKSLQAAAPKVNVKILPLEAETAQEIEKAFSEMFREKAGAVVVAQDSFLIQQRSQIAELAAKGRLPSVSGIREYAEAGGMLTYGSSIADNFRRAATYVDKILKGAKPADLPVEQPIKF